MTRIMLCETHYDKNAVRDLRNAGFTEINGKSLEEFVDNLIYRDFMDEFAGGQHTFDKYIVGIARLIIAESGGDPEKAMQFLDESKDVLSEYLLWAKEEREKFEGTERTAFDDEFLKKMSYQDVVNKVQKIQSDLDAQSKEDLANMDLSSSSSDYEVIPIESYQQMHDLFGGTKTGDGISGGWCHTNGKTVYDGSDWTNHGRRKFYVLAKKGWEDIPYNERTSVKEKGADEYGNSLIAILVDRYGQLLKATLRCNHQGGGNMGRPADKKYKTWAELAEVTGMDVEAEIRKSSQVFAEGDIPYLFEDGIFKGFDPDFDKASIRKFTIPEGCTEIRGNAFGGCENLDSIVIPNTVTSIRAYAFINCYSLTSITIPESVTKIGKSAFANCRGLTSVTLPEGLTGLGAGVFKNCYNLTSVNIPEGITYLNPYVFHGCSGLTSIEIPNGVDTIGEHAISNCGGLTSIEIPSSVKYIKDSAFSNCVGLTSVVIPETVRRVEDNAFYYCRELTDVVYNPETTEVSENAFNYTPYAKAMTEGVKKESTKIRRAKKGRYGMLHEMLKSIHNK